MKSTNHLGSQAARLIIAMTATASLVLTAPCLAESKERPKAKKKCGRLAEAGDAKKNDFGIALNVLDQSGDRTEEGESKGFRFFEGASLYYSLGRGGCYFKPVALLSALDFDDDVDLETGVGFGLLFEPGGRTAEGNRGRFTISLTHGYNLMTNGGGDGWYTVIGFGWNFGRAAESEKQADDAPAAKDD